MLKMRNRIWHDCQCQFCVLWLSVDMVDNILSGMQFVNSLISCFVGSFNKIVETRIEKETNQNLPAIDVTMGFEYYRLNYIAILE